MFPNTAVVGPIQLEVASGNAWAIKENCLQFLTLLGPSDGLSEHSQGCTSFTDGSVPNTHNPLPRSQTTSLLLLAAASVLSEMFSALLLRDGRIERS